ncbi:DNA-methyltransferase [Mycolicibacterium wolinskyi]|uniref:DNA-methyltransferase n=1 Tax=Mycolicibacterium wolinskyi TaxID=59750 RepID=UPI003917882A
MNRARFTVAPRGDILVGDALDQLRRLPDASVDMVLTSPPYFRLRNYQHDNQIGLEPTVEQWVGRLAAILTEARRVLVPTGTLWLNLGDTYASHPSQGAPRKSLLLGPERLALRLHASGWILRNKIVWAKPNPMPISVTDRLAATYEYVYVLAQQPCYFFDLDAIRVPHRSRLGRPYTVTRPPEGWRGPNSDTATGLDALKAAGRVGHPLGKNPGDVWTMATAGYRGHHATFPLSLATRAITAGCPEARCHTCRRPWRRRLVRTLGATAVRGALGPTCDCRADPEPGLVLDPFIGSGTTAVAADNLGRDWLGIELNPDFAALARQRIAENRSGPRHEPTDAEAAA